MTFNSYNQDKYIQKMIGAPEEREQRLESLFEILDPTKSGRVNTDSILYSFKEQYHPSLNNDNCMQEVFDKMCQEKKGYVCFDDFKQYLGHTEEHIALSFKAMDTKQDGRLDFEEVFTGLQNLSVDIDTDQAEEFFNIINLKGDGYISYYEWAQFLLFVPLDGNNSDEKFPLQAAYNFFVDEIDLSSEGDYFLSSETLNGLGYFLAGGFAGVVSRTCTAPFDRLKVYLIAQSGQPMRKAASVVKPAASSVAGSVTATMAEAATSTAKQVTNPQSPTIIRALKHIWSQGGIRAFFVGNGLNVFKVFPESAMKFGSFEAAKRFFANIEGVRDTTEISRASTFISGGIGGVVAQFTVYPIDTLKFRIQCQSLSSKSLTGNALIFSTMKDMWNEAGFRMFYRGIGVGVCGIFPFAAIDLGTFEALKRFFIAKEALAKGIPASEVRLSNPTVLAMGAFSGCIGASLVYPVNLLRTRLQAQGTPAHPYTYSGFMDVYYKTVARDGYRGLWRGLAPNLAKVGPAVSISYLIYENMKSILKLD